MANESNISPIGQPLVPIDYPPSLPIQQALQREQALLTAVVDGQRDSGCLLWRTQQSLVVPARYSRVDQYQFACNKLCREGWHVVERNSGGDVVPQTPGISNISVVFPLPRQQPSGDSIAFSYHVLCSPIVKTLREMGIQDVGLGAVSGAFCDGAYNVTIGGTKVAGTAQRWRWTVLNGERRAIVMAHAALIVDEKIDVLVNAVNRFYTLCGIEKHCESESHTSVLQSAAAVQKAKSQARNERGALLVRFYRLLKKYYHIELATVKSHSQSAHSSCHTDPLTAQGRSL